MHFSWGVGPCRLVWVVLLVALLLGAGSSLPAASTSGTAAVTSSTNQSSSKPSTPAPARPSSTGRPTAGNKARHVNSGAKPAAVNAHPAPGLGSHNPGGRVVQPGPRMGTRTESMIPGRTLHAPGMTIHRDLSGTREIVSGHDDYRVVSRGAQNGYVQRPYLQRKDGRLYVLRTYVSGSHKYSRIYKQITYGDVNYYIFVPPHRYAPGFYAWLRKPWPAPILYKFGNGTEPWYKQFLSSAVSPSGEYASGAEWVTDYAVASTYQEAYEADPAEYQQEFQNSGDSGDGTLSPAAKQSIVEQAMNTLDSGTTPPKAGSSDAAPSPIADTTYHVNKHIEVLTDGNTHCSLNKNDWLQIPDGMPMGSGDTVTLVVLVSKDGECPKDSTVQLGYGDLIEMHNLFAATLFDGSDVLATSHGHSGIPQAQDAKYDGPEFTPPLPDADARQKLEQQNQEADRVERQAKVTITN